VTDQRTPLGMRDRQAVEDARHVLRRGRRRSGDRPGTRSRTHLRFLPVLVDDRRRASQDFLAGTVVVHADLEPAEATEVADYGARTTHRKPMCEVEVSTDSPWRAAGR
jgi:hypothetical protein